VLKETARIPFGRTRTYRQIADKAGQPDAYRVVLATLVVNPLPIVIPCHRVTTNKSGIGSYVAGSDRKRWLLEMEREALASREEG
jgi:O-6-methylguanine DNA methyltransferase